MHTSSTHKYKWTETWSLARRWQKQHENGEKEEKCALTTAANVSRCVLVFGRTKRINILNDDEGRARIEKERRV